MKIAISDLAHHPLNSEIYELDNIDDLASSISQLGLLQALVIDKQNKIISGNRRFAALKKLGWDSVTVQQIDVEQRAAEFIVHYNKQRVKKVKEILNEYRVLKEALAIGKGKRTDLETYGQSTVSSDKRNPTTRDLAAEEIGISSSQLNRIIRIQQHNPKYIEDIDAGLITINQALEETRKNVWGNDKRTKYGETLAAERHKGKSLDFFETPSIVTEGLFELETFDKNKPVLEPAQGRGAIVRVLEKQGFQDITAYDIETDFLTEKKQYPYLITNPPFSQHIAFIEKAKEVVTEKFCFLLPTTYLTGKERYAKVYADKSYGLSKIYIFVKSPNLTHEYSDEDNAFYGGLTRVGWFVFEKGYSGPAMLDWIDNTHA